MRLNGWMRIGIVLSILWLLGSTVYFSNQEYDRYQHEQGSIESAESLCDFQNRFADFQKVPRTPCQTQKEINERHAAATHFSLYAAFAPPLLWLGFGWAAALVGYLCLRLACVCLRWIAKGFPDKPKKNPTDQFADATLDELARFPGQPGSMNAHSVQVEMTRRQTAAQIDTAKYMLWSVLAIAITSGISALFAFLTWYVPNHS